MNKKIPKSISKGPSALAVVLLIVSIVLWVPNTLPFFTNKAGVQGIFLIILFPVAIIGSFCAYYSGLTIAKLSYGLTKKHYIFWSYFWLVIINVICTIICVLLEIALSGNPIQMCFDACTEVNISTAIICYSIFTTIILLPSYYAILRYFKYVKNCHLPKPS